MKLEEIKKLLEGRIEELKNALQLESCWRKKRLLQETVKTNKELLALVIYNQK